MTHLTLDEIADPDTAIHHPHLADCARCRRAVAEQAEIRALLSSLPDPGPAPSWVMSRVDHALAEARADEAATQHERAGAGDDTAQEEQAHHAAAAGADERAGADAELAGAGADEQAGAGAASVPTLIPGPDRTIVPLNAPRRRDRRRSAWLAAAAAVVLLGGGGLALRGLTTVGATSSDAGAASAASGVSGPGLGPVAIHRTGTDYTASRLATQLAPLLSGAEVADQSGTLSYGAPSAGDGRTSGKTPEFSGGTDTGGDAGRLPSQASPAPGRQSLLTPSGVAACLNALGVSGATVLAVDLARFQGAPAAVIALRPTGSPTGATQVWVVSPDCRPGADGMKYFATLP